MRFGYTFVFEKNKFLRVRLDLFKIDLEFEKSQLWRVRLRIFGETMGKEVVE